MPLLDSQSQNDYVIFADEQPRSQDAGPAPKTVEGPRWKVLVADDEEMVHTMTHMVLANFSFDGRGVELLSAYTGAETRALLQAHPDIAVMLLDVVMEQDDTGLDLVRYVRKELRNDAVRIILRTGQPGQAPEAKVIVEYDINDYREKTDLSVQKLNTSLLTALRTYRDIMRLKDSESALKVAIQKAEEASRIKSQFLANVSHEIRTPLNGIALTTQLMKATPLDPEQKEYVTMLSESVERLLPIVNDILDLSRIETGKIQLEKQLVDLRELIERTVRQFLPFAETKGLRLQWSCDQQVPPRVILDGDRLGQVLGNLVGNAVKYTDRGSVDVVCELKAHGQQKAQVALHVRDTGSGISEEERLGIFQPFTQGVAGIRAGNVGAGLGLAITKDLVTAMGGDITLESSPGEGSCFSIVMEMECV